MGRYRLPLFRMMLRLAGLLVLLASPTARAQGVLPSWNEGPSRLALIAFVAAATTPGDTFIDDKAGKPVGIQAHIGRRPVAAFGNSDGDFQMLEWTTHGAGTRLGLLVRHDDAAREYAYDRQSAMGRLARGLDEAPARGWVVVSMQRDWKRVFVFEP